MYMNSSWYFYSGVFLFRRGCGFYKRKYKSIAVDIHLMILFLYFSYIAVIILSKSKYQHLAFLYAASLLFRCIPSSSSRWWETIWWNCEWNKCEQLGTSINIFPRGCMWFQRSCYVCDVLIKRRREVGCSKIIFNFKKNPNNAFHQR